MKALQQLHQKKAQMKVRQMQEPALLQERRMKEQQVLRKKVWVLPRMYLLLQERQMLV
jgi:hypothetical protein